MHNNLQKVLLICDTIYHTCNLDTEIYDGNFTCLGRQKHIEMPVVFAKSDEEYYRELIQLSQKGTQNAACTHHLKENPLVFLDVCIHPSKEETYYISIGCALDGPYDSHTITNFLHEHRLPSSLRGSVEMFFSGLVPYDVHTRRLFEIIRYLLFTLPDLEVDIALDQMDSFKEPAKALASTDDTIETHKTKQPKADIETRIELQSQWELLIRNAISRGDLLGVQRYTKKSGIGPGIGPEEDSLRNLKNHLHSLNFMEATSAQDGGADPVQVYKTYEQFQTRIEEAKFIPSLSETQENLAATYCQMVVNASVLGHSELITKALTYIRIYYAEPLTLSKVAKAIHCSEGHLSRTFQKEMNTTLRSYVTRQRIEHALSLLQTHLFSITDVALLVGFSSYTKFSVAFKKEVGVSATEYRKQTMDAPAKGNQ